jgi:6-phosphogluconolactonase
MYQPTRRSILLRTAAGAAAALLTRRADAQEDNPVYVYVGSYTARGAGIYVYRMNPSTGQLTLVRTVGDQMNPSFLALDASGRYLYAVNEIGNYENRATGSVTSFRIDPGGVLTMLNRQPTEGRNPAHISIDPTGRYALVANYSGGNVAVLPIQSDGSLGAPSDVVAHRGDLGPNTARQEAPHAHMMAQRQHSCEKLL